MSNSKLETTGNGVGFGTLLFLLFLGLKLGHVITWSWWWVFAPFWIPAGIVAVFLVVAVVVATLVAIFSKD
jgi:hypothetical protein